MYHIKYKINQHFEERVSHGIRSGNREVDKEIYSDCTVLEILNFLKGVKDLTQIESVNYIVGEIMQSPDVPKAAP